MGKRSVDDASLSNIADAIRDKTDDDNELVFPEGFMTGINEVYFAGKQSEYDRFWSALQENGRELIDYRYKFFYWPNEAYQPKYPIFSSKNSMMGVFQNARIENTLVDVDFSKTVTCNQAFGFCTHLHTIPKLIVSEKNTFTSSFTSCIALENLTVEGTFGANIDFQWSKKLSKDSLVSIIGALSDAASGLAVTLSLAAVDASFSTSEEADGSASEEWAVLAATKPNWTINLV